MLKVLFSTALTDTKVWDVEGVGVVRYSHDGNQYLWVQNGEAAATDLAAGNLAYHKLSDGANMKQKVYKAATANLGVLAGVVMGALQGGSTYSNNAQTTNTYTGFGWVQTYGINTSVSVSGATTGGTNIAAGDYLKGVNAATYAVRDAAVQPQYTRTIQALDAVATTTTPAAAGIKCLIQCA